MSDASKKRHLSDSARGVHVRSSAPDGSGGKCLNRHVSYWAPQSCSHRWQAYLHAVADSSLYNWPRYDEICDGGSPIKTDVVEGPVVVKNRKGETRVYPFYPNFYQRLLDPPRPGDWDVGEAKNNFKKSTVKPYYHNAHHIVTNSELNAGLGKVGSDVQGERPDIDGMKLIRDSLLRAGYNLNHKMNMIILPMDREVAKALRLPRHLAETTDRDHPRYSEIIKKLLRSVMNDLRKEIDNALANGEAHDKIKVDLCKARLEKRSETVYNLIIAAAKDPRFDGTLETVM